MAYMECLGCVSWFCFHTTFTCTCGLPVVNSTKSVGESYVVDSWFRLFGRTEEFLVFRMNPSISIIRSRSFILENTEPLTPILSLSQFTGSTPPFG